MSFEFRFPVGRWSSILGLRSFSRWAGWKREGSVVTMSCGWLYLVATREPDCVSCKQRVYGLGWLCHACLRTKLWREGEVR